MLPATASPRADGNGCELTLGEGLTLRSTATARGAVTVVVRADAIRLSVAGGVGAALDTDGGRGTAVDAHGGRGASNVIPAHVSEVRDVANGLLVSVDAGARLTVLVPRAYQDGTRPEVGDAVELEVPRSAVHVIPTPTPDATESRA